MTERNVLPFPSADHNDADIAARVAALYAATPPAERSQADRCARHVRARAMHSRTRSVFGVPRTRWWLGAAAAAALIMASLKTWPGVQRIMGAGQSVVNGAVTALDSNAVRFDLRLPSAAKAVAVVGDFNGWDARATPMARRKRDGTWSVNVPLTPGRHVYAFVVNGAQWVVDPMAPRVPDDGYGPANAVMVEGLPK